MRMQIKGSGSQCENEDSLICSMLVSRGNCLSISKRIKSKGVKRPGKFFDVRPVYRNNKLNFV